MSGICGIFNLDNRPVDFEILTRMNNVMPHLGQDNSGIWTTGSIGIGHRMLWTTPESRWDIQPLADEDGKTCLAFDGRIDNRFELRKALKSCGITIRNQTDSELLLQAYKCWGENCCSKIIGDYAFVIWDGLLHQLFCARDFIGMRPLYYYMDREVFIFSTELRQLFEHPKVKRQPNEGMVAEYLTATIVNTEETLYQSIYRLPAAHFLIVKPEQQVKKRYWNIDPNKIIRHRTDQEYAEHFLDVFTEAVRCRLRSYGPVAAELSGGLDSSSIVAVTQTENLLAESNTSDFATFSLVFPGMDCDESTYIRSVVNKYHLQSNELNPEYANMSWFFDQATNYFDFPWYPHGYSWYQLRSLMQKKGHRVVLTGAGGDEWFTGSAYHYADYLKEFNIRQLISQLRSDRQFQNTTHVPAITLSSMPLLKYGLFPLIPVHLRRVLKWGLRRKHSLPAWIDKDFADKITLVERIQSKRNNFGFTTYSQQAIAQQLNSGWLFHGNELAAHSTASLGIEIRCPYMDQRIVEFALALPEGQRWRNQWSRYVIRYAMRDLLPKKVRQRRTKADFSHIFAEALVNLGGEQFFGSLTIAEMGWVNSVQVKKLYHEMFDYYSKGDVRYIDYIWELWMVFGIELWFNKNILK